MNSFRIFITAIVLTIALLALSAIADLLGEYGLRGVEYVLSLPAGVLLPVIPLFAAIAVKFQHRGDVSYKQYLTWLDTVGWTILVLGYALIAYAVWVGYSSKGATGEAAWASFAFSLGGFLFAVVGGFLLILRGIIYDRRSRRITE